MSVKSTKFSENSVAVRKRKFSFALLTFVLSIGFFAFSLVVFQTVKVPKPVVPKETAGESGAINNLRDRAIKEAQASGQTEYSYEFRRPFPFPL